MKMEDFKELDDGREDVHIDDTDSGEKLLFISEKLYPLFGFTYEEMKEKKNFARFLMTMGKSLYLQEEQDENEKES